MPRVWYIVIPASSFELMNIGSEQDSPEAIAIRIRNGLDCPASRHHDPTLTNSPNYGRCSSSYYSSNPSGTVSSHVQRNSLSIPMLDYAKSSAQHSFPSALFNKWLLWLMKWHWTLHKVIKREHKPTELKAFASSSVSDGSSLKSKLCADTFVMNSMVFMGFPRSFSTCSFGAWLPRYAGILVNALYDPSNTFNSG